MGYVEATKMKEPSYRLLSLSSQPIFSHAHPIFSLQRTQVISSSHQIVMEVSSITPHNTRKIFTFSSQQCLGDILPSNALQYAQKDLDLWYALWEFPKRIRVSLSLSWQAYHTIHRIIFTPYMPSHSLVGP
jgi:hypothetical protein